MADGAADARLCTAALATAEQRAVADAVSEWNERAGTTLSADSASDCVSRSAAARTFVVTTRDLGPKLSGWTSLSPGSEPNEIWLNVTTDDEARRVSLHEIGHALGLAHSGDDRSIMYPNESTARAHLTDADVQAYWAVSGQRLARTSPVTETY